MFVIDLQKEQQKQQLLVSKLSQKRDVLAEQKQKLRMERRFYSRVNTALVELPADLHVYRGYDGLELQKKIVLTEDEKVHSRRLGGTYLFSYIYHKYCEIIRNNFLKWRRNIAIDGNLLNKMFHLWRGYVSKITLRRMNGLIFIRKTYKLSIVWKRIKKQSAFQRLVTFAAWNKQHRKVKLLYNCWKWYTNQSHTMNNDKIKQMSVLHARYLTLIYFKKMQLLSRRFHVLKRIFCKKALSSWVAMAKLDALLDTSNLSAFPLDDYMCNTTVTVTVTNNRSAHTTPVKSVSSARSTPATFTPKLNKKSVTPRTPLSRNTSIREDRSVSFFDEDVSKVSHNISASPPPKSSIRIPKSTASAQEKFLYRLALAKEAAKSTEGR